MSTFLMHLNEILNLKQYITNNCTSYISLQSMLYRRRAKNQNAMLIYQPVLNIRGPAGVNLRVFKSFHITGHILRIKNARGT